MKTGHAPVLHFRSWCAKVRRRSLATGNRSSNPVRYRHDVKEKLATLGKPTERYVHQLDALA
jgi:hypothetical protein